MGDIDSIMTKLKIKPVPATIESNIVTVHFKHNVNIVDKRKTSLSFDMDAYNLRLLNKNIGYYNQRKNEQSDIVNCQTCVSENEINKKSSPKQDKKDKPNKKDKKDKKDKKEEVEKEEVKDIKKAKRGVGAEDGSDAIEDNKDDKKNAKPKSKGIKSVTEIQPVEIQIRDISQRFPPQKITRAIVSDYYMNNRDFFMKFINDLFSKYKDDLFKDKQNNITCDTLVDDGSGVIELMSHQKIVRDYLNIHSPYRGLLLYHGLGSGKTCSSIAIAEGLKTKYKIIVMTPASLHSNYIKDMKKCGDILYRRDQYWEWIPIDKSTKIDSGILKTLGLTTAFVTKQKGVWLVDITKKSNHDILSTEQQQSLDVQIIKMIEHKYTFIHYNGLREKKFKQMTSNYTKNIFDNSVVIVDEAHNLVSRIVNRLKSSSLNVSGNVGNSDHMSIHLYDQLMGAQNCRIVFLTGTPIINYMNEISILFNILRGYIRTWKFVINTGANVIDLSTIEKMFKTSNKQLIDYIDYIPSSRTVSITRNPYYFESTISNTNSYGGVHRVDKKHDNEQFVTHITNIFKKNNIKVTSSDLILNKALPDKMDDFEHQFMDESHQIINIDKFKKRIIGLTSYFRSVREELMPRYDKLVNFTTIKVIMSDYQFQVHEHMRTEERQLEEKQRRSKKSTYANSEKQESSSTYKIRSRLACNFVMPDPPGRPVPTAIEDINPDEEADDDDMGDGGDDDMVKKKKYTVDSKKYAAEIKSSLDYLKKHPHIITDELHIYSPKFLAMLNSIKNPDNEGLHMVYSQFRTMEGIGIFTLVLDANGFERFQIIKEGGKWKINGNFGTKPTYVLYTGTESKEEKEILLSIYNGDWENENIPNNIATELKKIHKNNNMGEVIKIFMITSSGSEGISLKNTRYIHITEPYWNPIRIEQVIGRARRICSHSDLDPKFRTVDVFIYISEFSSKQLEGTQAMELKIKDRSKFSNRPLTSDETLYEIAGIKEQLTSTILTVVKESSIDCNIHIKSTSKEGLDCMVVQESTPNSFIYKPDYKMDDSSSTELNKEQIAWDAFELKYDNKLYIYRKDTNQIYDYDNYQNNKKLVYIGRIEKQPDGKILMIRD